MPTTGSKIANALQGFGAGVGGRGSEFLTQQADRRRALDEERSQAVLEDAFTIQHHLNANNPSAALSVLSDRRTAIEQLGGDPSHTVALENKINAGDYASALQDVGALVDLGVRTQRLTDPRGRDSNAQISAPRKVLGVTASGKRINGSVVVGFDPNTGQAAPEFLPDVGAVDPNDPVVSTENVGTLGLTGKQQLDERQEDRLELARQQTVETKKRDVSKLKVKREQGFIDEAISVGDELPEMKRALALLQSVGTGGFSAAAIRAKQLFGIESADEGELAAKLGVAVLARLRSTFGAQFTEREGDRLDRVSARMGANTATNIRLLGTTIKRMEREMRRGAKFAESFEDQDALDLINTSLSFTFDGEQAAGASGDTIVFDAQGNVVQ